MLVPGELKTLWFELSNSLLDASRPWVVSSNFFAAEQHIHITRMQWMEAVHIT